MDHQAKAVQHAQTQTVSYVEITIKYARSAMKDTSKTQPVNAITATQKIAICAEVEK